MQPYSMGNLLAYVDDPYSGRFSTTTILASQFYGVKPYIAQLHKTSIIPTLRDCGVSSHLQM